jgi:hypothetical protein
LITELTPGTSPPPVSMPMRLAGMNTPCVGNLTRYYN